MESRSGLAHMVDHERGDHNWSSRIDDADMVVLGYICEAIHESLPVVSWEDFIGRVSRKDDLIIDWIANTEKELWIRFSHDPGGDPFWGITHTDQYVLESVGFMPVRVANMIEEVTQIKIIGMMDDIVFIPRKNN